MSLQLFSAKFRYYSFFDTAFFYNIFEKCLFSFVPVKIWQNWGPIKSCEIQNHTLRQWTTTAQTHKGCDRKFFVPWIFINLRNTKYNQNIQVNAFHFSALGANSSFWCLITPPLLVLTPTALYMYTIIKNRHWNVLDRTVKLLYIFSKRFVLGMKVFLGSVRNTNFLPRPKKFQP